MDFDLGSFAWLITFVMLFVIALFIFEKRMRIFLKNEISTCLLAHEKSTVAAFSRRMELQLGNLHQKILHRLDIFTLTINKKIANLERSLELSQEEALVRHRENLESLIELSDRLIKELSSLNLLQIAIGNLKEEISLRHRESLESFMGLGDRLLKELQSEFQSAVSNLVTNEKQMKDEILAFVSKNSSEVVLANHKSTSDARAGGEAFFLKEVKSLSNLIVDFKQIFLNELKTLNTDFDKELLQIQRGIEGNSLSLDTVNKKAIQVGDELTITKQLLRVKIDQDLSRYINQLQEIRGHFELLRLRTSQKKSFVAKEFVGEL